MDQTRHHVLAVSWQDVLPNSVSCNWFNSAATATQLDVRMGCSLQPIHLLLQVLLPIWPACKIILMWCLVLLQDVLLVGRSSSPLHVQDSLALQDAVAAANAGWRRIDSSMVAVQQLKLPL